MSSWTVAFTPLVPLWLLAGLTVAAFVVSAALLWRRSRGAWLRALAFALALIGLTDPNLVLENRRPLKDIVALVVDRSESQQIGGRVSQTDKARDESRRA